MILALRNAVTPGLDPGVHSANLTASRHASGMDAGIKCRCDDGEVRVDDNASKRQSPQAKHVHDNEGGSDPMAAETPTRTSASRLAASRAASACGEEGLATAFQRACDSGLIDDFDDLDHYLEAVLEGEADDVLAAAGWRDCTRPGRCLRARRCLARAGGTRHTLRTRARRHRKPPGAFATLTPR